ncbi:PKD domain-containing protein [Candidatus Woesearchaeota archaeon]|nr:PKD domain-containing protein [Candidatus Woesearchaeota archaeon]
MHQRKREQKSWIILDLLITLFIFFTPVAAQEQLSIISSPAQGTAPLYVAFSAASSTAIDSYAWDFTSDGVVDSTEPTPVFTYPKEGVYTATLTAVVSEQPAKATSTITVTAQREEMKATVIANPTEGTAPLTVQFIVAATGKEPLSYSWDFDMDGTPESSEQNPTVTFSTPGQQMVQVKITDADSSTVVKKIPVSVVQYDSGLNLTSYFPTTLHKGENSVTFIITNNGTGQSKDITAKIVGMNIQQASSTTIPLLQPGDQDSLTVKVNILEEGVLAATAKVLDKNFPLTFTVDKKIELNKSALQAQLDQLKSQFREQEGFYYDKKANGYIVNEMADQLKDIQEKLQDTQEKLLLDKLQDASVNLNLLGSAITDLKEGLLQAKKPEVTLLQWMKENALAITAIIAAFGTLSGIMIKLKHHAVSVTGKAKELVVKTVKNGKKEAAKDNKEKKEAVKKEGRKEKEGTEQSK